MSLRQTVLYLPVFLLSVVLGVSAQAAERDTLRAFLEITGFDVAIASMQQGAMAGPGLAGDAPDQFGKDWVRLAEQIFDPDEMIDRAMDMMAAIMPDDLVDHGADFYASDLGQRIVVAENQAHMVPDEVKYPAAETILADLIESESPRVAWYRDMGDAVGGVDNAVRSAIEIQVRYLLAEMAAGESDIEMSEEDLRGLLLEQADAMRQSVQVYSMLGNAYAYREITDPDVEAYLAALQDPRMRQVYEILNAIQFEVMAERYERLAKAVAGLHPQQDI